MARASPRTAPTTGLPAASTSKSFEGTKVWNNGTSRRGTRQTSALAYSAGTSDFGTLRRISTLRRPRRSRSASSRSRSAPSPTNRIVISG